MLNCEDIRLRDNMFIDTKTYLLTHNNINNNNAKQKHRPTLCLSHEDNYGNAINSIFNLSLLITYQDPFSSMLNDLVQTSDVNNYLTENVILIKMTHSKRVELYTYRQQSSSSSLTSSSYAYHNITTKVMQYSLEMYSETLFIPFTADNINLVHLKSSSLSSSSLSLTATTKESTISSLMLSSFKLIGFIHLVFQSSSNVDYIRKIKDLSSCLRTLGVSIIVLVALRSIKIKYSKLSKKLVGYIDIIITEWIDLKTTALTASSSFTVSIANTSNPETTVAGVKKLNHVFVVNVKVLMNRDFDNTPNSFIIKNDNDDNLKMMMPYQNIIVINKDKNNITYREGEALNISYF